MNDWYFQADGQIHGPYSLIQLKEKAVSKAISAKTMVRKGQGPWSMAGKYYTLFPTQVVGAEPRLWSSNKSTIITSLLGVLLVAAIVFRIDGILGFYFLVGAILIYFIPSIIARNRNHHNLNAITALNFLLGWTFIGWTIALVWALTAVAEGNDSEAR